MAQLLSEEKPPKKPYEFGNVVICKKDFEDYKEFLKYAIKNSPKDRVNGLIEEILQDNAVIEFHNKTSTHINQLIENGKEDIAYIQFVQSFPSCLPHRTSFRETLELYKLIE